MLLTAIIGACSRNIEWFHVKQLRGILHATSYAKVHCDRFIISGASYIRIMPSAEHVANTNPCDFGPNLQSVTLVLESTKLVRRIQRFTGVIVGVGFSPIVSSQTETVRSKEHVANTAPNSG